MFYNHEPKQLAAFVQLLVGNCSAARMTENFWRQYSKDESDS